MKRLDLIPLSLVGIGLILGSCASDEPGGDDAASGPMSGISASAAAGDDTAGEGDDDDGGGTSEKLDVGGTTVPGCDNADIGCTDQIDLLIVIDNSGTMGQEQVNLARNFPLLIEKLEGLQDSAGMAVNPDVQIMVTTTDFGNPLCTPFEPEDYEPSGGAPISSPCTDRLARFTDLTGSVEIESACTDVCPNGAAPSANYIAFQGETNNVNMVPPTDINGDGTLDSPVAQALACIGPQGIDGCGYESPLENMLQALNPGADWNTGPTPFLRPDALLAIAIVTDEADCSVKDYSIMDDATFQETNPDNGMQQASSAICWNAGVQCTGPDANGVFSDCTSRQAEDLQPITRYTNYLINDLRDSQKKEVIMLGILGVPEVTAHNDEAPFEPTAGGVFALEYRNWVDGQYTGMPGGGDILPDEFAMSVDAADKQFDFGIGPGCTGQDSLGAFTGQAIPPVRIKEVCEELNLKNEDGSIQGGGVRCCIESICDTDFSDAIECLTGIIQETIQPPG
ncbi:MAG: hypothetical protein JKY37_20535 [Nannocystaceae bacterium]|nr:hypothetical protein [Nannocystaceae bacterium]